MSLQQKAAKKPKGPGAVFMPNAGTTDTTNKTMIYGPVGSGKSFTLVDLILAGERLFVVSTEQGGSGLVTVANELKRLGKTELYKKHVFSVDLNEHGQVLEVFAMDKDPDTGKKVPRAFKHYPALAEFDPTILVWEGFRNYQVAILNEHLLTDKKMSLVGEDKFAYWDGIRMGSLRTHQDFQSCNGPDKPWHHILTVHEDEEWERDSAGAKSKFLGKKAAIQGKAADSIVEAYDLVLQTVVKDKQIPGQGRKLEYLYRVQAPSGTAQVKKRGYDLPDEFEADMKLVWDEMTRTNAIMTELGE